MHVPDSPSSETRRRRGALECIGDVQLTELLAGNAPATVVARAMLHAADCDACRELLACAGRVRAHAKRAGVVIPDDVAADDTDENAHSRSTVVGGADTEWARRDDVEVGAGRTLGRYVVLETVGRGGMGQVLRAYDPKLRREVALKVVRTRGRMDAADAEARLLREAHALARLSHPNVVAVYDAETTDRGVAIAMEYVEGRTLRAWLEEHPRTWKQVVDVGVRIAAGIEAVHAAGLVHRDVKPDNVLCGNDGRVRVSDFGLARGLEGASAEAQGIDLDVGEAVATLTGAGQLVGTPAYMAPEQYDGAAPDARADQYALCLLLYEALHGARPFQAADLAELAMRKRAGPPQRAPSSIPSWLHAAVIRGLAADPEARWPSVEALRQALASGRRRGRRPPLLLAVGVVSAIAAAWAGLGELDRRTARSACMDGGRGFVHEHTGDAARAELHAAIAGANASHAADTADRVVPMIHAYAGELQHAHTEVCISTNLEHRVGWDAEMLDRARWCLDERRSDLAALRAELLRGDATAITHAVSVVSQLAPVQPCTDAMWLARLPLPPATVREDVRAVRAELSRARALEQLGAYTDGLAIVEAAHASAKAIDWPPLSADARRRVGSLLGYTGAYEASASELEAAYFESMRAGASDVAARAAVQLIFAVGDRLDRHEEGLRWSLHAEVLLATLPDPLRIGEANRLGHLGSVYLSMGSLARAKAAFEGALAIEEAALGEEDIAVAATLHNIAIAMSELGEHRQAIAAFRRVLKIEESALGREHPEVATTLNNIGVALDFVGSYEEAEAVLERALRLRRAALGDDHPYVASTLGNLGHVHHARGDYERARDYQQETLRIHERTLPTDHPDVARSLHNLGAAYKELGDHVQARQLLERALAIQTRALGPDHVESAKTLGDLGGVAYETGEYAEAVARFERAVTVFEAALGREHPHIAHPLVGLAEVALVETRPRDAVALAERSLALRERSDASPDELAAARFLLARAIAADGGASPRALSLAERAHQGFLGLGPRWATAAARVETWLTERGSTPGD